MKDLLFTELILKGTNESYKEAYDRLKFCNFDDKTIEYIILSEKSIIKKRNLRFNKKLCDTFWWLNNFDKYKNKTLFEEPHNKYYFIDFNKINDCTLTLSEIVAIYDEAYYIAHLEKNVPNIILKETTNISEYEDYRSWLIEEFYNRIEILYRLANNIDNTNKAITDIYKIHTFYDNEMHIIMSYKWRKILNVPEKWTAYTNEYYQS